MYAAGGVVASPVAAAVSTNQAAAAAAAAVSFTVPLSSHPSRSTPSAAEGGGRLDAVDLSALNVLVGVAEMEAAAAADGSGRRTVEEATIMASLKPAIAGGSGPPRPTARHADNETVASSGGVSPVRWASTAPSQQQQQQPIPNRTATGRTIPVVGGGGGGGGGSTFYPQQQQQRQYQHQQCPIPNPPVPDRPAAARPITYSPVATAPVTNPPVATALAPPATNRIYTLGSIMVRPSQTVRWGLCISLFDQSYLILGRADERSVRPVTVWAKVVSRPPLPAVVLTGCATSAAASGGDSELSHQQHQQQQQQNRQLGRFRSTFEALPSAHSELSATALSAGGGLNLLSPHLQSGDLIISLNGIAVSSFPTIAAITSYLRSTLTLTVVALRHYDALCESAAALVVSGGGSGDGTALSARVSYAAFRRVLSARAPPVPTSTSGRPPIRGPAAATAAAAAAASRAAVPAPAQPVQPPPPRRRHHVSIKRNFYKWLDIKKVAIREIRSGAKRRIEWKAWETKLEAQQEQQQCRKSMALLTAAAAAKRKKTPAALPRLSEYEFLRAISDTRRLTNPLYRDEKGDEIPYYDNDDVDPDDGTRAHLFLNPFVETSFHEWLAARKKIWREQERWPAVRAEKIESGGGGSRRHDSDDDDSSGTTTTTTTTTVVREFWLSQGYPTFSHWLEARKSKWRQGYSWHRDKRRKLEMDSEEVVQLPSVAAMSSGRIDADEAERQFRKWLQVRKSQWRIMTRKRQRRLAEETESAGRKKARAEAGERMSGSLSWDGQGSEQDSVPPTIGAAVYGDAAAAAAGSKSPNSVAIPRPYLAKPRSTSSDVVLIDEILEEEERRKKELDERPPLDILFVFDAKLGAPDDVITNIMECLRVSEHWKLLCVSFTTSMAIRERQYMWRALCPSHWTLPSRPRVPWYRLYTTKIRLEEEIARKQSDGVLLKAAGLVEKGDHLGKVEKLIRAAQSTFAFSVDYTSGVVLERNSILNLAVINRRHKIARWLLESKGANIETSDRGNFTPLLNAAWAGDRYIVRYLLSRGANRAVVGTQHSSQALAHADFKGFTAEGWARKRGHPNLAELIRLGL